MIVGVPRESFPGERRVALIPSVIPPLIKSGAEILLEAGAGVEAGFPDADYAARGARMVSRGTCSGAADVVLMVRAPRRQRRRAAATTPRSCASDRW